MEPHEVNEGENLAHRTEIKNRKLHVEKKDVVKKTLKKHQPRDYKREDILKKARQSAHNSVADCKRDLSNEVRKHSTINEGCDALFESFDFIEESVGCSKVLNFELYEEPQTNEEILESLGVQHDYYDGKYLTIGMAEGCFAPIGVMSRNNRIYDEDHYSTILENENIQRKLKSRAMLGTIGHHNKKVDDEDLANDVCSHVVTDLEVREDENGNPFLYGRLEILNTTAGRRLRQLYEHGIPLYVSSRGGGKLLEVAGKDYKRVDKNNYYLETFDIVKEPGFLDAKPVPTVSGIVHENLDETYNGELKMKNEEIKAIISEAVEGEDTKEMIAKAMDDVACLADEKCHEEKKEEKAEEDKKEEDKVDKRDLLRQIMAIAGKHEDNEDVRTIAKLAEKIAYDKDEKCNEELDKTCDKKPKQETEDDQHEEKCGDVVQEELDKTCEQEPKKEECGESEELGDVLEGKEHPADCECEDCKAKHEPIHDKECHEEKKEDEEKAEDDKKDEKEECHEAKKEDDVVDKRDLLRQIMAIAGKREDDEDVRTIAKLAEKIAYDKDEKCHEGIDYKAKYEALEPVIEELLSMVKDASANLESVIKENADNKAKIAELTEKLEVSEEFRSSKPDEQDKEAEQQQKVDDSDEEDRANDAHEALTEEKEEKHDEDDKKEEKEECHESEEKAEELGKQISESIEGMELTDEFKAPAPKKMQVYSAFAKREEIPPSKYFSRFSK